MTAHEEIRLTPDESDGLDSVWDELGRPAAAPATPDTEPTPEPAPAG